MNNNELIDGLYAVMRAVAHEGVVARAKAFAIYTHNSINQLRNNGSPYWVHPEEVATKVRENGGDHLQEAAGWLHDVKEDVKWVPAYAWFDFFGKDGDLLMMVDDLSDISKPEDGNRETRKAIDREHTRNASTRAKFVKMVDVFVNVRDADGLAVTFAKKYIPEKRLVWEALRTNDPRHDELYNQLDVLLKVQEAKFAHK